eukprot:TRINITY_DN70225_c0_g1_i1.p1 TRINITY_DN70225_c0_g1~~TRINITY_DN70225_c0_g1_i1.p1  ORF type:complete len:428 (-),score=23.02 TRINITY_DN70225_c0_g1_i1:102-1385(-)
MLSTKRLLAFTRCPLLLSGYEIIHNHKVPVKGWVKGIPIEDQARRQVENVSKLDIVHSHVAVMPDVHWGMGCTVGTIIPTLKAIIPAAVGVDIGCGMVAVKTTLTPEMLPDSLKDVRLAIEAAVPHGRTRGGRASEDAGAWRNNAPERNVQRWNNELAPGFNKITSKYPKLGRTNNVNHLGTLGTGNHFIEVCTDFEEKPSIWFMLHSGSRGVGNAIGTQFIEHAKKDMGIHLRNLPDADLAYFREGTEFFEDYVEGVLWAQTYARINRELMMERVVKAVQGSRKIPSFKVTDVAINCHHNYVQLENHFGEDVWVTRKGAVRAGKGDLGIIPGSMGARSFIVRGLGNPQSFCSCSHGAGRTMSRNAANRRFTTADHVKATAGVECRKDAGVIDEIPMAYKDIDHVIAAQSDLVEVVYTLKQLVCVKG